MPRNYSIQDTIEMEKQKLLNKNTTEIISSDTNRNLQQSNTLSVDTADPITQNKEVEHTGFFRKLFKWL
jgi:hypothetical protein